MLTLLQSQPKIKPSMPLLWIKAFQNALLQGDSKKIIVAGVKYINASRPTKDKADAEQAQGRMDLINCIQMFMARLTPKEFMQLFPIKKDYDGDRWGCKDYFYTMERIREMDQDKPIGGELELFNFLWDYWNWEIDEFLVESFSSMDALMHSKGKEGPMDMLMDGMGMTPYYMKKDPVTGTEFMINGDTGKSVSIKKAVPRYLKLIES
ncbi:hypothetical protein CAFE_20560 [Caprobacter fermentans]|uniref:Uncharacterized protein n=1 Tax=Caproicibacter fermentans TaxID=2576756 RepID=A0A6N8I1D5_9FIRM|nr:hypothetical protein [Caproicibacter fermentans]MVB11343.1 hypothetical protein [Caproicibacter fermentans]